MVSLGDKNLYLLLILSGLRIFVKSCNNKRDVICGNLF